MEKPKRRRWSLEVEDHPASAEPGQQRADLLNIGARLLRGFLIGIVLVVILAFLAQQAIGGH